MTDYNEILDTQIDQDSAITEDLMTQIRDNPIAIAEGSSGAPRVQGIALGGRIVGAVNSSSGSWASFTGVPDVSAISIMGEIFYTADGEFQIGFSTDGGASWGSSINLGDITLGGVLSAFIDFQSGVSYSSYGGEVSFTPRTSSTNAFRIRSTSGTLRGVVMIEGGWA